jgi:hypothetical protein
MPIQSNLTGTYTSIAGIIVFVLAYFFPQIGITTDQIVTVISVVVAIFGAIKQAIDHKTAVAQANATIASARK